MCQDQGGPLYIFYDIGHRKGLAGASHPQEGLVPFPVRYTIAQLPDGIGLIPGRFKFGYYIELHFLKLQKVEVKRMKNQRFRVKWPLISFWPKEVARNQ